MSGKGLLVLRDAAAARSLHAIVERRARKTGSQAIHLLVEQFLDKQYDLTYQVSIERGGAVRFDFVKRAVIRNGVPNGHVIPAGLTRQHEDELRDAGLRIGAALRADGYFGVAGVDALVDGQGVLRPVVEIDPLICNI